MVYLNKCCWANHHDICTASWCALQPMQRGLKYSDAFSETAPVWDKNTRRHGYLHSSMWRVPKRHNYVQWQYRGERTYLHPPEKTRKWHQNLAFKDNEYVRIVLIAKRKQQLQLWLQWGKISVWHEKSETVRAPGLAWVTSRYRPGSLHLFLRPSSLSSLVGWWEFRHHIQTNYIQMKMRDNLLHWEDRAFTSRFLSHGIGHSWAIESFLN